MRPCIQSSQPSGLAVDPQDRENAWSGMGRQGECLVLGWGCRDDRTCVLPWKTGTFQSPTSEWAGTGTPHQSPEPLMYLSPQGGAGEIPWHPSSHDLLPTFRILRDGRTHLTFGQ